MILKRNLITHTRLNSIKFRLKKEEEKKKKKERKKRNLSNHCKITSRKSENPFEFTTCFFAIRVIPLFPAKKKKKEKKEKKEVKEGEEE